MAGTSIRTIYCRRMKMDRLYVYLASTEKGALRIGISLNSTPDAKTFFKAFYSKSELLESHDADRPLEQAVEAAFSNRNSPEKPTLDITCTPFQWSVMKAIANIPFGETRTYKEVAAMVGKPKGARAVGQAMGRNPLPLIFP